MLSNPILSYIDPATGAIVLQAVIATVFTVGVYFRKFFFAPFAFLRKKKVDDDGFVAGKD